MCCSIALASGAAGCKQRQAASPPPAVTPIPQSLPVNLAVDQYVGAKTCGDCHEDVYGEWKDSPHGRAMAEPSKETVLGAFDGKPVAVPGGTVTPFERDGGYWMRAASDKGPPPEELRIALVLASGRQHQTYLARLPDGGLRLMPLYWETITGSWIATNLYTHGSLDPNTPDFWYAADMLNVACITCHLSQGHFALANGTYQPRWVDLSVNCEACHGPGKAHVVARRAGDTDDTYGDLHALDQQQEQQLCGQCHGRHEPFHLKGATAGQEPRIYVTLAAADLRPDGTQQMPTYQIAGHLLSRCFADGAMTCSSCHDPHHQRARSLVDEDASGDHTDLQCTVCHRNLREPRAAVAHSKHEAGLSCVSCHMAPSWIGGTPERKQRTADHAIPIPRPQETIDFGTPNACNTCHEDQSPQWALAALQRWGYARATEVRPWVAAVVAGRNRTADATAQLLAVITSERSGAYLRQSAMELLVFQAPDPKVVPVVSPFARDTDPHTRASAISALARHDADPTRWIRQGIADPHPYVRYVAMHSVPNPRALTDEDLQVLERDTIEQQILPFRGLASVADAYVVRGKPRRALAVIENAGAHLSPIQRNVLGLSGRRAKLLQLLGGRAPKNE